MILCVNELLSDRSRTDGIEMIYVVTGLHAIRALGGTNVRRRPMYTGLNSSNNVHSTAAASQQSYRYIDTNRPRAATDHIKSL
jgi:hypothetical protein